MALHTSGSISLNQVQTEFGGSNPIGINEYYSADPIRLPASGLIDLEDFYGTSVRTTRIVCSANNDTYARYGYSKSNGYFYFVSESGQSGSAFGSATRTTNLNTGTLACVVGEDDVYADAVVVGFQGSNITNTGFTQIDFYSDTGAGAASLSTKKTLYRSQASQWGTLPGTSPTTYFWRWGYTGPTNTAGVYFDVENMIKNAANGSGSSKNIYIEFK